MKTQPTPNHGYHRTSLSSLTRIAGLCRPGRAHRYSVVFIIFSIVYERKLAGSADSAIGERRRRSRQFKHIWELS